MSLPRRGTGVYVRDPSTSVLCLGYHWAPAGGVYVTPHPRRPPARIQDALNDPSVPIVAHNALFERAIWTHVLGWDEVAAERWICTSNLAGLYNLPQSLGALTEYLFPTTTDKQKDKHGLQLIQKLSRPNPRTGEFNNDPALLQDLYAYCAQDVRVTERVYRLLPKAPLIEKQIQLADVKANEIGYHVDREFCRRAAALDERIQKSVVQECMDLTGFRPTQTQKLKDWLEEHGCTLPDMSRQTITTRLDDPKLPALLRAVLKLRIAGARGSAQKYESLLRHCTDDFPRVTHHTRYAAGNTGRWIARGAQIHNFRSRNLISYDLEKIKTEVLTNTVPSDVDIRNYVGGAVRASIIAAPGKYLALGDYSGMENRMLMYLAGEEQQLENLRQGIDVYRDLATKIFNISNPADVDPWQRQISKHCVLGLGFGMGYIRFYMQLKHHFLVDLNPDICRLVVGDTLESRTDALIDELRDNHHLRVHVRDLVCFDGRPWTRDIIYGLVTTQHLVDVFRTSFPNIATWWYILENRFHELLDCSVGSSRDLGVAGKMHRQKNAIVFELPSGRPMYYWRPKMRKVFNPYIGEQRPALFVDQATGGQMHNIRAYGARWGANLVQGISRDVMAAAFVDLSRTETWTPIATVHDEIISETEHDDADAYASQIRSSAQQRSWSRPIPLDVDADISTAWIAKG